MTVLNDIALVQQRRAISAISGNVDSTATLEVLRSGWDVHARAEGNFDTFGMARQPHLAIQHSLDLIGLGLKPVLSIVMNAHEIEAGIWRQLNIYPDTDCSEIGNEPSDEPTSEPLDPFSPPRSSIASRSWFLIALIGHSPRDIAEFIVELKTTDEATARLLLSKDLKNLLKRRPELLQLGWPDSVKKRWQRHWGKDAMPPVLAIALYAEIARLGQNIAAHLQLAFDERGHELTIKTYLETINTLATDPSALFAARRLTQMAPLSTSALVPPDAFLKPADRRKCSVWSTNAASWATIVLANAGNAAFDLFSSPGDHSISRFIRDGVATNPRNWPEYHEGKGWYRKKGSPATFRGLTWRQHAIGGLLMLAQEARVWSTDARADKNALGVINRQVERAIAAIMYCWVESSHPAALEAALAPVINAKQAHQGSSILPCDRSIDTLAMGESFGEAACEAVRSLLKTLPALGEAGYTAWYHAHLWFDDRGDDIAHYRALQFGAIKRHQKLLRRGNRMLHKGFSEAPRPENWKIRSDSHINPRAARRRLRRCMKMTRNPRAARSLQDCAMMMLPPSTDPLFVVNAAPERWTGPRKEPLTAVSSNGRSTRQAWERD